MGENSKKNGFNYKKWDKIPRKMDQITKNVRFFKEKRSNYKKREKIPRNSHQITKKWIQLLSTVNSVAFCAAEKPATELTVATELTLVATQLTVGWNCHLHMLF